MRFPETLIYTKSFLSFVDKVNEAGEGRGPDRGARRSGSHRHVPAARRGTRRHRRHGLHAGLLLWRRPAGERRDGGSNLTAVETRQNGGIELIDQIHQEKMGLKYLGWFDSGVCYNLWTRDEPEFDANGNLEVEGLKLRGNAVYNAFFSNYLGAQVIDLPTGEVYAGLQRGVVDATGWTQIGLIDLKWNEFLNYRIEPCFFSTDLGVIVNLDKWNSLSPESRRSCRMSPSSMRRTAWRLCAKRDEDFAKLEDAAGMKVVSWKAKPRPRICSQRPRKELGAHEGTDGRTAGRHRQLRQADRALLRSDADK
jgi:hypothetical protein